MNTYIRLLIDFQSSLLFSGSVVLLYWLGRWNRRQWIALKKNAPDPDALVIIEKNRFLRLFEKEDDETLINSNIHPDLFCFEKMKQMIDEETEEEKRWKSRVLFQTTPYGNLIMFYDLYKQAFAYFSDVHISYKWLNVCAMKYVRLYCCRDFFVDTNDLPEDFKNRFNEMKLEEERKEKAVKLEKKNKLNLDLNSDAFLRKKPKLSTKQEDLKPENDSKNENTTKKTETNKQRVINNFRRMGSIHNYQLLNKENIEKVSDPPSKKMSYKDFKKKIRFNDLENN
jgi:hypothetical protein